MKIRPLSIALAFGLSLSACGGSEPSNGDDPGTGGDLGGGGGDMSGGTGGDLGGQTSSTATSTSTSSGGEGCPTQASGSAANHIIISVSWPASLGIEAGEGEMHVWTRADLTFDGNSVVGTAHPCGSIIPELIKTKIAGGGKVQTQIPDDVWDSPDMPSFAVSGTISGFGVGATVSMAPVASTVGLTMDDPMNAPWPASAQKIQSVDHDGDGKPGIKAIPRTDAPFSAPPVDLGSALDPNGARADELYVATRTIIELAGVRDSCTTAKGAATVSAVDSHVVGCHIKDGGACKASQSDFIDSNQPKYTIKSAKYEMTQVSKDTTCAEIRAALPAQ